MRTEKLRWLHRWLGLSLGLVFCISALSGSWLIYHRELMSTPTVSATGTLLPTQQLLEQAQAVLPPDSNIQLRFPQQADQPYQFWSAAGPQVVIDQYSGKILAVHEPDHWPYGWFFELHTGLLGDKIGETILGFLGLGCLVLVIIGIVRWWPDKPSELWRFRLKASPYLRHHDLHGQFGIIASPLLLLALVTGISLCFSELVTEALDATFARSESTKSATPEIAMPLAGQARTDLDHIITAAHAALPGGRIGIIQIPSANNAPVVVRKQLPEDPHPNGLNFIYIDPYTALPIKTIPLENALPGRRWFNWIYPLHTGQALQPWHQWLLLVCGLIPPALLFTGFTMYLIRRRAVRKRNR